MGPAVENEPVRLGGTGSSRDSWGPTRARIAVAVAVIRSRPPGTSGRQNAEALGRSMRRQDQAWKQRAQDLQQEVLRLRQEVLVARTTADTADANMEKTSQDLFSPETSDSPLNSETPDFLLQRPAPAPPCLHGPRGDPLLPHSRFLQAVCSLQRLLGGPASEGACWTPEGGGDSAPAETLRLLLDSVTAACRDPLALGGPGSMPRACRVAAQALDLLSPAGQPPGALTRRAEETLREMTRMLVHRKHAGQGAEQLKASLAALGSSRASRSFTVHLVLSEVGRVAEELWQTSQVQLSAGLRGFSVDQYQNSCHLLWVLEKLLLDPEVSRRRSEVEPETTAFLHHLEPRVFLLWDEFPLFSVFMWRIGKLLSSCLAKLGQQRHPEV